MQADLVRSRDFWEGPQPLPWLRAHCRFVIICGAMYVLLLITGTTVGVATVQTLDTFDDLQACEKAAAEQLTITKVLRSPTVHFRCQRQGPDVVMPNPQ